MRILHFHDSPKVPGGATKYLKECIKHFNESTYAHGLFSMEALEPSLIAPEQFSYVYPWNSSFLARRVDFYKFHAPLADSIEKALGEFRPDLIHIHNWANFRNTFFNTILNSSIPSIMTVHDFSLNWEASPQRKHGIKGLLPNLINKRHHQFAAEVGKKAVGKFLCPTYAIQRGLNLPQNKSLIHRLPIEPQESYPPTQGTFSILFAGSLFHSKGVDVLLRACKILQANKVDFLLNIAGKGDQEANLKKLTRSLGLEHLVKFSGYLDPVNMNLAYKNCHLVALPSRVPENSPLTVLEAGVRGRAALASHLGGVPELIEQGRGFSFISENSADMANKLIEISKDLSVAADSANKMREWVLQEFSPTTHWKLLSKHYQNLLS